MAETEEEENDDDLVVPDEDEEALTRAALAALPMIARQLYEIRKILEDVASRADVTLWVQKKRDRGSTTEAAGTP